MLPLSSLSSRCHSAQGAACRVPLRMVCSTVKLTAWSRPHQVPCALRVRLHAARTRLAPVQYREDTVADAAPARSPSPPVMEPVLKVIGLGVRGASCVNKLAVSGQVKTSDFWVIDSDKKVVAGVGQGVQALEVAASDDANLSADDLAWITGEVPPVMPETKDGGSGVVFVLGSALGSPGGATLMLQLVNHLRRQGYFVSVALTRPFGFEGARKLEQADALIEAMEEVAHLMVVVDQDVLTKASSELTMPEACAIADKTLQYTVRSILWALKAPEILKVTHGSFLWHGRDLRAMKRPLFPPMMSLLTCPGHGHMGRGQATIPIASLQHAGLPSMLSTLAEDAVRAASESPFLDDKMATATAVLCVLRLPRSIMEHGGKPVSAQPAQVPPQSAGTYNENYREYALRSAVQVAAMTVRELAGPRCCDIVVCPQLQEEADEAELVQADPATGSPMAALSIECSLLVLKAIDDMAGVDEDESPAVFKSANPATRLQLNTPSSAPPTVRAGPLGAAIPVRAAGGALSTHSAASAAPAASRDAQASASTSTPTPTPSPTLHSASKPNWNAMSMLAGGSAAAAHGLHQTRQNSSQQGSGAQKGAGRGSVRGYDSTPQPRPGLGSNRRSTPQPHTPSTSSAAPRETSVVSRMAGQLTPNHNNTSTSSTNASNANASGQQIPRMSESLVTSLVAQSLDLPPRAARWRHQQRSGGPVRSIAGQRIYDLPSVSEAAGEDAVEDGEQGSGQEGAGKARKSRLPLASLLMGGGNTSEGEREANAKPEQRDLRSRVSGMLDRERGFR